MKRLSIITALTLSTMLSACGGGGGGHSFIPPTIPDNPSNPDQPVVSCTGLTCMTNEGLSNTAKRNKLYSQALGSSGIALFTSNEVASEDVTQAFTEMKTQLVDTPIDENDGEGLRPYLILAGFEDLPETEADLINWIANRKYMIKRHAEKAYNMYGTEKQVYLDNAKLHLVEETANQDTFINFTIDENKNINGIEVSENDFGAEAITDKLNYKGGDEFQGTKEDNTLHKYVFRFDKPGSGYRTLMIEVSENTSGREPDLDVIKEKLQLKLQERAAEALGAGDSFFEDNKTDISQAIKDLENTDSLAHNVVERTINANYTSKAKNLGGIEGNNLLYSDFGLLDWKETRTNTGLPEDDEDRIENLEATKVFAGGYDTMKVNPEGNLHFEGDAVGGVNYKQIVSGDETIRDSGTLKLAGKATLDFNNGQEKLKANFNNWYDVDVTKNLNTNTGSISFSGGDKSGFGDGFILKEGSNIDKNVLHFKGETDNAYANNNFIGEHWDSEYNGHAGAMDIGYYGKDGTPSEATGYVMYHEEVKNTEDNNLFDVLEMQIGVGMQKK